VRVLNNGRVLEPEFDLNKATGLGLSIVRTLVTTELAGSLSMRAGTAEDFVAVDLPEPPQQAGTVVDLRVPLDDA
jgi:hypothetical protein